MNGLAVQQEWARQQRWLVDVVECRQVVEIGVGEAQESEQGLCEIRQFQPSSKQILDSSGRTIESSKRLRTFKKTCMGKAFVKKDLLGESDKQILQTRYLEYLIPKKCYAVQGMVIGMSLQSAYPRRVVGDGVEFIFTGRHASIGCLLNEQWLMSESHGIRLPVFLQEEGKPGFLV